MNAALRRTVLTAALTTALCCSTLSLAPTANAMFKPALFADQIVRLWFNDHNGAKVQTMLAKLPRHELLEIYDLVEAHPFVMEIRDNPPDERSTRAYNGLIQTFRDIINRK